MSRPQHLSGVADEVPDGMAALAPHTWHLR